MKGCLSEITFVELLRIVGKHNGRLRIWNLSDQLQCESYFADQSVVYLNYDGKSVSSREEVKDIFLELLTDSKSRYEFQKGSISSDRHLPIVSVTELLDFSVFETPEANDDLLPHINTKFETVNKFDFSLQGELADFWRDSIKLLHKGCSGYDLCIELGLEERFVRQNLYKLRTTGLIKPVRLFSAVNSLAKVRMMRQNVGSQIDGRSVAQPTSVTMPVEKFGEASLQAAMPNSAIGAELAPRRVSEEESPFSYESAATPDFLLKETHSLPLPQAESLQFESLQQPPVQPLTAAAGIDYPNAFENGARAQNNLIENVPANVQAAHDPQAMNVASANPKANQEKPPAGERDAMTSKRVSLIKRMLNSLFKS